MSNLQPLPNKKYDEMSDKEQEQFLKKFYGEYSFPEMAEATGTYPNKLRRQAIKLGIEIMSASDAQKNALNKGRHPHPTKGKERSTDTKLKISETMAENWANLTPDEYEERIEQAKKNWSKLTELQKREFQRKAGEAVRQAAVKGSKLEIFFLQELIRAGFKTNFHPEYFVKNHTLQIDLYIPQLNVAIEVDGPSHFSPIWGEDTLAKNKQADAQKDGLLLASNLVVIRIQQRKPLSASYKRKLLASLLEQVKKIEKKFPPRTERHIVIGD